MIKETRKYTQTVGRRKSSSARVRLLKGTSQNMVNDKPIGKYFPGETYTSAWQKPFELTDTVGKYYVTVKVLGGGIKGQLDATVLGISRALAAKNPEKYRSPLKKAGLLTRDSRIRERRKPGTGGRARKQKQSPKR